MASWYCSSAAWGAVAPWASQQNWAIQTDAFDAWTASTITVTANSTANPRDATANADTLNEATGAAARSLTSPTVTTPTTTSGQNYCASVYVKSGTAQWVQLALVLTNFSGAAFINVDLTTGTIVFNGGTFVAAGCQAVTGQAGWYRIWLAAAATATATTGNGFIIGMIGAATATRLLSYTGASKTIIVSGAQLEPGTIPGAYTARTTTATALAGSTTPSLGTLRRQTNPAIGNERVFRCTTSGATGSTEPTWVLTKGATTTDTSAVWTEVTGNPTWQVAGTWAPHARIANAIAWAAAGDDIYVGHTHAETQNSAMTWTFPGAAGATTTICRVVCVDSSASGHIPPTGPDVKTTGTVTVTGAFALTTAGNCYVYGLVINNATLGGANTMIINSSTGMLEVFESCTLALQCTGAARFRFNSGGTPCRTKLVNTVLQFGANTQMIDLYQGIMEWRGGSVAGIAPAASTWLVEAANGPFALTIEAVDLSAVTSAVNSLVGNLNSGVPGFALIKDCKIASGVAIAVAGQLTTHGSRVDAVRCDSASTNYRNESHQYAGVLTTETTVVRTGGATDGTTPFAHKIVTNTTSSWACPFEGLPLYVWNETTGSPVTITVYGIWGGGAVPNIDDCWIDVEYLSDASSPDGSQATSGKATALTTTSGNATDTSTWGGSTTKFKMSVAVTPQKKGPLSIYPKFATASSTFYIDPEPVLS